MMRLMALRNLAHVKRVSTRMPMKRNLTLVRLKDVAIKI